MRSLDQVGRGDGSKIKYNDLSKNVDFQNDDFKAEEAMEAKSSEELSTMIFHMIGDVFREEVVVLKLF